MSVMHEPWLVALSLVMAFQGSFVGLNLAVQVGRADAARRRLLLAGQGGQCEGEHVTIVTEITGATGPRVPVLT